MVHQIQFLVNHADAQVLSGFGVGYLHFFAVEQDLALTPLGVGVEAEFSVMKELPKLL